MHRLYILKGYLWKKLSTLVENQQVHDDKWFPYPMQVCVGVFWHVVVKDNVHSLNVHATTKQICGNKDSLLEIFELLVT